MEKRTLAKILKNINNSNTNSSITLPVSGMFIISNILEEQNLRLLNKIANKKFSDLDEREHFIQEYHKVGYHIPELAETFIQERLQKYLL